MWPSFCRKLFLHTGCILCFCLLDMLCCGPTQNWCYVARNQNTRAKGKQHTAIVMRQLKPLSFRKLTNDLVQDHSSWLIKTTHRQCVGCFTVFLYCYFHQSICQVNMHSDSLARHTFFFNCKSNTYILLDTSLKQYLQHSTK